MKNMIVMGDKKRKELIRMARMHGGVVMLHQKLQIHSNGAKFPVSKVYIDDEMLDADTPYTILVIPETTAHEAVLLSYFDRLKGPTLFYSNPESALEEETMDHIFKVMDAGTETDSFFDMKNDTHETLNYVFMIPSDWARGREELLMITVVFNTNPSQYVEENVLDKFEEFVKKTRKMPNLFKAFYKNDTKKENEDLEGIKVACELMDTMLHEFERELSEILNPTE